MVAAAWLDILVRQSTLEKPRTGACNGRQTDTFSLGLLWSHERSCGGWASHHEEGWFKGIERCFVLPGIHLQQDDHQSETPHRSTEESTHLQHVSSLSNKWTMVEIQKKTQNSWLQCTCSDSISKQYKFLISKIWDYVIQTAQTFKDMWLSPTKVAGARGNAHNFAPSLRSFSPWIVRLVHYVSV